MPTNVKQLSDYIEAVFQAKGMASGPKPMQGQLSPTQEDVYFQSLQTYNPLVFTLDTITYLLSNPQPHQSKRVCFLLQTDLGHFRVILVSLSEMHLDNTSQLTALLNTNKTQEGQLQLTPQIQQLARLLYKKVQCIIFGELGYEISESLTKFWVEREIPLLKQALGAAYGNVKAQAVPLTHAGACVKIAEVASVFLATGKLVDNRNNPALFQEHISLVKTEYNAALRNLKNTNESTALMVVSYLNTISCSLSRC